MKYLSLALALFFGATVWAQNPYVALLGASEGAQGAAVSAPRTTLAVDVVAECDRTLAGPYARFAQKYLGVRAPMTDKVVWTIRRASVALLPPDGLFGTEAPAASEQHTVPHAVSQDEFTRIQPDKVAMGVQSLEDAARSAASTIFSLRRHRIELITGDAGENVFGEGLKAALDEIARLEQAYLELFFGKHVVTTDSRRYVVYPQSDKMQYIVCRFSSVDGLLPESDLSGDMVLLQITPSGQAVAGLEEAAYKDPYVACRVADLSVCTVSCSGRECARAVLPLFEFGKTVRAALPRRK
ncbi:MAG: DUF4831 family protein [Alistipes sp.]|nr:DUF4831 family protein [Alistipes sp.]